LAKLSLDTASVEDPTLFFRIRETVLSLISDSNLDPDFDVERFQNGISNA
jgi:hypothetical protein